MEGKGIMHVTSNTTISKSRRRRSAMTMAVLGALGALPAQAQTPAPVPATTLPEVSVTGTREKELLSETPASVGAIKGDTVQQDRPTHPSQIMSQIPGVAVAVTNGEGHTTSIRQPFTTGPVYLFLEDGVPIRSTGFFNHNALYEIDIPQSAGIEVIRGPGTALYGSDAIGGIINVLTRTPPTKPTFSTLGELGSFGWRRLLLDGGNAYTDDSWRGDLNLTHTDGWRDKTAYDRQSGVARWDRALGSDASLKTVLGFSHVDQKTGANSPLVLDDYLNHPTKNYLPIAFRKVNALRLHSAYEQQLGSSLLSLTPYFRDNSMDLLASFNLNNDPTISRTENRSFGLLSKWRTDFPDAMRARLIAGLDLDVSPGGRREDSLSTITTGTGASREFQSYSVAARVYDYDVTFRAMSPYLHGEISPTEKLRVTAGARYDHLSYSFDNHFGASAIAVPAPAGTFPTGTRFYGQSDDTTLTFTHTSPKLGATYALSPNANLFVSRNHGFRAPSEGDLFRPSAGTSAAAAQAAAQGALALKPIRADQVEVGVRGKAADVSYDVVLYDLKKRDDIVTFRDTTTNFQQRVNAGMTRHRGIEIGAGMPVSERWRLDTALSYSRQTFVNWVVSATTGNTDFSAKEISAAPRVLANTRLTWFPKEAARVQLEWVRIGSYWMDDANTAKYPGHDLYNLRTNWGVSRSVSVFGSINNLADKRYADSASISSGTQVFSPGLPRSYYAGVEVSWL
jgi:outer membrane receptor protein involved in Fe transport